MPSLPGLRYNYCTPEEGEEALKSLGNCERQGFFVGGCELPLAVGQGELFA